jgi:hypothetical protein
VPVWSLFEARSTWALSTTRAATNLRKFKGGRSPQVEDDVVHQQSYPRAECDDCKKQLVACQWSKSLGSKHWQRTKILMSHSSSVCSDSGSNEKRPIVRVWGRGISGSERELVLLRLPLVLW